jgi:adenosylcobalamin-dependent ribonucleoside-triphosphate reductase
MGVNGVSFLSSEFLTQYEGKQPKNKGPLFEVVYLRTYSRFIPEKKRRETWQETCKRVVDYSMSLYQGPASEHKLQEEAELMFDKMFNLQVLPAGRTMWIGGTESVKKYSESSFNCAFCVIDSLESFTDVFKLLLVGTGVGFRLEMSDVEKLPTLSPDFELVQLPYQYIGFPSSIEHTFAEEHYTDRSVVIHIGDSKDGWAESLEMFLEYLAGMRTFVPRRIELLYNAIRPEGSRLKTFGGRAAGHAGLQEMFERLGQVIKGCGGKLSPVDALDVCNLIAKNVVVGGTRRSAQVALGSPQDTTFIEAKLSLYTQNESGKWVVDESKSQRTMSNNSITYRSKPSKQDLSKVFERIMVNGEPGFFNLEAAKKRRPNAEGSNPCMEISLDNHGVCNLSTVVLTSHLREDGTIDRYSVEESIRLATRIGMRQTNVTLSMPKWDEVQKRDRLTGVSMTGVMDAFDALGWEFDSFPAITLLSELNEAANSEADDYAYEMRIPRPLLVTAIKPEGTLSLLPTVSAGLHRGFAPYFIRRISVSAVDPVAKALQSIGVPNEPDATKENSGRLKFSFPIKTAAKIAASAEPARRQLDRYLTMQRYYTDHNSSCTLTLAAEEVGEIVDMVHENWDEVIACAFLPKFTKSFPQMPYEEITEEQYNEMMLDFPDLSTLGEVVNRFEQDELVEDELEADCSGGACPVR